MIVLRLAAIFGIALASAGGAAETQERMLEHKKARFGQIELTQTVKQAPVMIDEYRNVKCKKSKLALLSSSIFPGCRQKTGKQMSKIKTTAQAQFTRIDGAPFFLSGPKATRLLNQFCKAQNARPAFAKHSEVFQTRTKHTQYTVTGRCKI